ncbi:MAG: hypothetical protein JSV52_07625 [Candidatus Zixiibacteriota bacterium]|nr:MAG: hypothetical protein JSV52_07625 [candidate division Zixibacteria bacterium]
MLHRMLYGFFAITGLILSACASGTANGIPEARFINHDLTITFDVPNHRAEFVDDGSVELQNGWNVFGLSTQINIEEFTLDGEPVEFFAGAVIGASDLPEEVVGALPEIDSAAQYQQVLFRSPKAGTADFHLAYSGEFYQDVSNTRFSNEMVGKEITATIDEKGAYLSSEAYYYPVGSEEQVEFKLAATIPEEWESISDGNRLDSDNVSGRKFQTWENPYASDGLTFFASKFIVGYQEADGVGVYCYFFPEDSALMDRYLTASADYIRMYNELIGPYPYRRFTVVENFFPTGYGMPGWTLLGQQVLRLPFIVSTSLGHEVLHNWWGNAVFVDYEKGNWCEGITVYGADYRYKLMSSEAEARDYRKNILKQYISYINEGNDFPLREFTSRSDPSTRTIGYNKSMMVFHMIEELIGTEAFFGAWRKVYRENLGRKVSWEDWVAAFETTSGKDLSFVISEWIDRPGAPVLAADIVEEASFSDRDQRSVKLRLSETSGQGYYLSVPVRFYGNGFVMDTSVTLDQPEKDFFFTMFDAATELVIDPGYDLFRKLYPEEVEPVISAILGNPEKRFMSDDGNAEHMAFFGEFGNNMTGVKPKFSVVSTADSANESYAIIMGVPLPEYLKNFVTVTDDSVTIADVSYSQEGCTFILTGQDWQGFGKYMFIMTQDYESLPRIGQLIPHYGKYSYLVFQGARNVGKGQWEPESSPLKIKLDI